MYAKSLGNVQHTFALQLMPLGMDPTKVHRNSGMHVMVRSQAGRPLSATQFILVQLHLSHPLLAK